MGKKIMQTYKNINIIINNPNLLLNQTRQQIVIIISIANFLNHEMLFINNV